jgi:hypothetical protein
MRRLAAALGEGVCPNLRELCLDTVDLRDLDLLTLLKVKGSFVWLVGCG